MDASKAFDKVWRMGLFAKLIDTLGPAEFRALYNYYLDSWCYIEVNGEKSKLFKTGAGVKQGGPLFGKNKTIIQINVLSVQYRSK